MQAGLRVYDFCTIFFYMTNTVTVYVGGVVVYNLTHVLWLPEKKESRNSSIFVAPSRSFKNVSSWGN